MHKTEKISAESIILDREKHVLMCRSLFSHLCNQLENDETH